MDDAVGYAVAFVVLYGAYRYFSSGSSTPSGAGSSSSNQNVAASLGFTPKRATQEMVAQVQTMFPDQPYENIHYDLLRTGSVELTTNKILEQGFLPRPPQVYHTLYPTQPLPNPSGSSTPRTTTNATQSASSSRSSNLITKFDLQERISSADAASSSSTASKWEATAEKREMSLKERKAQMILAARERMLAKQNASS